MTNSAIISFLLISNVSTLLPQPLSVDVKQLTINDLFSRSVYLFSSYPIALMVTSLLTLVKVSSITSIRCCINGCCLLDFFSYMLWIVSMTFVVFDRLVKSCFCSGLNTAEISQAHWSSFFILKQRSSIIWKILAIKRPWQYSCDTNFLKLSSKYSE